MRTVAKLDWAEIEPAIFGTLFERGLDPDRRTQLGAHYTDRESIDLNRTDFGGDSIAWRNMESWQNTAVEARVA